MSVSDVRPSPIAGQWYAGEAEILARDVDALIAGASPGPVQGELIGLVVPHAGHRYSGAVAAQAFSLLVDKEFEIVAVVSPFHAPHNEPLLTTAHRAYSTPLGDVEVNVQALDALSESLQRSLGFGLRRVARDNEHSLEIEIPFLQRVLRIGWQLLPIMIRAVDPTVSEALGRSLAEVVRGKPALLVASTDLSHFFDQETAIRLDVAMLDAIQAFSPTGAFEVERSGRGSACGLGALAAVMWAARALGANKVNVLKHATSGDVTGDYSSVVGYAAAAFSRS